MKVLNVNLLLNIGAKSTSILSFLALQMFAGQTLTKEEFGIFLLMLTIALGLTLFAQGGCQTSTLKYLSSAGIKNSIPIIKSSLKLIKLRLIQSTLIFCAVFLVVLKIHDNIPIQLFFIFTAIFYTQTILILLITFYRANNQAYIGSFLEQGVASIITVAICYLLIEKNIMPVSLISISFVYCLSLLLTLIIFIIYPLVITLSNRPQSNAYQIDNKKFLKESNNILTTNLADYGVAWGGVIIATLFLTASELASLNVVQRISQSVILLLITLNTVAAPRFSKLYAENRLNELATLAKKSNSLVFYFSLPICLIIFIWGKNILVLFKITDNQTYYMLLIAALSQIINAATGSCNHLLNMTGHSLSVLKSTLYSCTLTIICAIMLTPILGGIGAILAYAIGIVTNKIMLSVLVAKKLSINIFHGLIFKF